uniref:NADH-ubiquinone oxidoreductase chain 4L n=1 Tax=Pontoscolex corethrurus TaxID=195581 RepID=A0A1W5LJT6_9ANNE|nr:NADH dehydrogenase subunit 4L [Pontoscolex corethrurus]ANJ60060.1 NADH dehydrogenase subunit 4L [Pontoscolex corethrurus]
MNPNMALLIALLPFVTITNLIINQYHLLMTLLSLEGVMLTLVLLAPLMLTLVNAPNISLSVILLSMGACEASLGLSLMVIMSRNYGTDMLNLLSMNKC